MEKFESVGKNVEKAIENGLKELNVSRDKVNIEIVDAGGLFKKAKVILTIEDEEKDIAIDLTKPSTESELLTNKEEDVELANDEFEEEKVNAKEEQPVSDVDEKVDYQNDDSLSVGANCVKQFVEGYLKNINLDAFVEIYEDEDAIRLDIVGRDTNKIIGKHGEGLNALQYLCNIIANKVDRDCGRVYVDTCGYKEQREQELIKLARKLKFKVLREEKEVKLEPMSAYDRKIIHKALHDDDSVETHSEGEEPKRFIVITLKEKN